MSQTTAQLISGTSAQSPTFGATTVTSPNGGQLAGTRNRIINGDMRIDQRNAGAAVTITAGNIYTVDRWYAFGSVSSKFTVQRSTTAPSGFSHSALITSTSAYTVGASEEFDFAQYVEGFNAVDLGFGTASAKSITVSFWVRSSLTGTFGGAVTNYNSTRSYPFSYTISAANTFEYKTIVIAGDTSGTWNTDNTIGLNLSFSLGAGSTKSGTAGAWTAANYPSATGATSVVATSSATFYITGVQLEPGTVATPFERRSYGQELSLCQRYFQQIGGVSGVPWALGTLSGYTGSVAAVFFGTLMRTSPTLNVVGTGFNATDNSLGPVTATVSLNTASNYVGLLEYSHSTLTNNAARRLLTTNTTSFLQFSAEL